MKRHHTNFFRVAFLLLSQHLLFEVMDIHLVHSPLLNLLNDILDTLHARLEILEQLVGKHLILGVLRILLQLFLTLSKLRVHHLNLCLHIAHFFNLLSLSVLDSNLLSINLFLNI